MTITAGRNDPCLCGSGRKYKKCCGQGGAIPSNPQNDAIPRALGPPATLLSSDAQEHPKRADAALVLRQHVEATVSDRQTLEHNRHLAETFNGLGDALLRLANFAEAAANYQRALKISPGSAEIYNNLGSALRSLGRLDEAAASFRQALEVKPDFAKVHGNLGSVLRSQGRTAEAEASCRRALALEPDLAPTLVLLAELRADQGCFSEAQALLERTIEVEPQHPQAWAGLARWRTMTHNDTEWLAQAQRIVDSGLPPQKEVFLRYAIGKYFDDVQMFPQAFDSYQRANELQKRSKPKHHRELLTRPPWTPTKRTCSAQARVTPL